MIEVVKLVPTASPTISPSSIGRPRKVAVCRNVGANELTTQSSANFKYILESNETSVGSTDGDFYTNSLPDSLSGVMIDMLKLYLCDDGASLAQCVLSISSGSPDYLIDTCVPDVHGFCGTYYGSLRILFGEACSNGQIQSVLFSSLNKIFSSNDTITLLNKVTKFSEDGASIVSIKLLGDGDTPVTAASISAPVITYGVNGTGASVIAITIVAALSLVLVIFAIRRSIILQRRKLEDDLRSCKTKWPEPSVSSNVKPDFLNLAGRHSRLNVHNCSTALCPVCRPNLGVVNMIPVARQSSQVLCPEAYLESGIEHLDDTDISELSPEHSSPRDEETPADSFPTKKPEKPEMDEAAGLQRSETVSRPVGLMRITSPAFVRIANARRAVGDWSGKKGNTETKQVIL